MSDNYTPIHNEVVEALTKINLSPYETRVLFVIWRKTYGFIDKKTKRRKKEDYISLSQIAEMSQIDRRLVSRAIKGLKTKGIITRDDNMTKFTKKFMTPLASVEMMDDISRDDKVASVEMLTKEKKETYTKEIVTNVTTAKQYGNPEINEVISYMKDTLQLPTLDRSVRMNRNFAQLCIKKYGFQNTKLAILAASKSNFWRHKLTNFQSLYNNAQQIVGSAKGEVKSYDAEKILSESGQEGIYIVGAGVPNTEAKIN